MKRHDREHPRRGFSFVELLVTAAIISLVFGGLLTALQSSINLISNSKASAGAIAIANERMEYIRSLPYDSVGTVAGIPSGSIPQNATSTLNGITYVERILIQYVDAPEDGTGVGDTNGILADYKLAKVEVSWGTKTGSSSVVLLSNIVPPGIESVTGGGTLTVNVFDAAVQPVSGASVHVYNDTTTSTIDTTVFTNTDGIAMFAGAPAAANYQITVTDTGYSTDQTYSATTSNPNPNPPHVAVIESAVSTMNFQIDELSDLTILSIGPSTDGQFADDFDDLSSVATSTDIALGASSVVLAGGAGSYAATGTLFSASTSPAVITSWDVVSFTASTSASTTLLVRVYEESGPGMYMLVPDGDLPSNSAGFASGPIDISSLDLGTYPTLVLGATLTTSDVDVTPELGNWSISYIIDEPDIPNISFTLTGDKTIGTTASATPVYKYQESLTTDGSGELTLTDLEWDIYSLSLNTAAYDIAEACDGIPYILNPDVTETLKLTLVASAVRSLRVSVVDGSDNPVIGATVDLTRPAFNDSGTTSSCGQVFFSSGLAAASDYQVDVSAPGYTDETVTDIDISGDETLTVILST